MNIKTIQKNYDESNEKFSFQPVSLKEVEKRVTSLDIKRVISVNAFQPLFYKLIQIPPYLSNIINKCI